MNTKRPFVPAFLQQLDDALLRTKPTTWAARTHLVLYFAALFALVLTAFCFLVFFDAKQYSNLGGWITFVGLIAFMGLVYWLIFLLRFNVFKRYGNWFAWYGLNSFALYFISIAAMVAICFIPSAIETFRANQQFGNDEIVNDINELNTNACKLEYNLLPLKWRAEEYKVFNEVPVVAARVDDAAGAVASDTAAFTLHNTYYNIDTAELRRKLVAADSVVKVNDSIYIFYECPDYLFVKSYSADDYSKMKVVRSKDIYYSIIKNYQKPDRAALLKRMEVLKIKYAPNRYSSYYQGIDSYNDNDSYDKKINTKYDLWGINNGIDNAVQKKYAWLKNWDSYTRVFYYITLILTMLVFVFRHTTVKTFFLSLLTGFILFIFTGLMMVVFRQDTETSILSFLIVYYVLFAALGLSVFGAKVRKAMQGIGLNIFLFMTPFMPLVFVALNQEIQRRQYYNEPGYTLYPDTSNYNLYLLIAEITGSVLLLVLLEPLFKKLYRKWFAAPEN
jgi:hypothetical protein